jgi:hypothetical protein
MQGREERNEMLVAERVRVVASMRAMKPKSSGRRAGQHWTAADLDAALDAINARSAIHERCDNES